jgi:predicted phage terminase large subunit-like protein
MSFNYNDTSLEAQKAIFKATILDNEYIPRDHMPFPKQMMALLDFRKELLYGGAGASGKSDYLLMAALQFIKTKNYNAILFRRSYSDLALPDGLIPRSHEWLTSTDAKWKPDTHQWYFSKYNSTLTFGYLESENDIYRYKSAQFQFAGYEELTEFPSDRPYTYLFSRMRKLKSAVIPLRMRATTNPDGPGADWVYDRFLPDNPQPTSVDRRFLGARLTENPHIDQESYHASLAELDPITRMQIEDGVWKVKKAGNKFKLEWFKNRFVTEAEVPTNGYVVRYWDLAATEEKKRGSRTTDPDWTVGVRIRLAGNIYYIEDMVRKRVGPAGIESTIKDVAELDGQDVTIFIEQEPGATGKIVIDDFCRRVLTGYAAFGDRPTGSKEVRANILSAALYNGNVRLVSAPWNKPFIDELVLFPTKGVHDDIVDSASGAVSKLPRVSQMKHGSYSTIDSCGGVEGSSEIMGDDSNLKIEDVW